MENFIMGLGGAWMSSFDPRKLSVSHLSPADTAQPLEGRKYTLTHSDRTAELFLDIGYVFNFEAINPKCGTSSGRMEDEGNEL